MSGIAIRQIKETVYSILGQHLPLQQLLVVAAELLVIGLLALGKILKDLFNPVESAAAVICHLSQG